MTYWVYENWRAESKAVIHRSDCGRCNDGRGCHGSVSKQQGQWLGPFDTLVDAKAKADATKRPVREDTCIGTAQMGGMQTARQLVCLGAAFLLGLFVISSHGCGTAPKASRAVAPSSEYLATIDYGPVPPPTITDTIKGILSKGMKDPYSAVFRFGKPEKFWIQNISNGSVQAGHLIRTTFNAKNSYGAYVGETEYWYVYRGEEQLAVMGVLGFDLERNVRRWGSPTNPALDSH